MTIKELKKKYYQKIDSFDFDILLSFVLKKQRVFILSYPEKKLSSVQIEKLEKLFKRRVDNEPLAYIIGEKEFFSNKFIVNKNVLIPRPETEIMVEKTVKYAKHIAEPTTIIDVGTGSGCIVISIAKELKNRKNINYLGLDISKKALVVAKKNAKLNKVENQIHFIKSNLFLNISQSIFQPDTRHSKIKKTVIITANLPYLTKEQIAKSTTIEKEPRLALLAGRDGLKYYRKLFKQIKDITKKIDFNFTIFCEIDPSQKNNLRLLASKSFLTCETSIINDLRGLNRFLIISS